MANFISRRAAAINKEHNAHVREYGLRNEPEPENLGILMSEADFALCEHGVNIVGITLSSESEDTSSVYAVSFEFLVTYKDSTTRWAKDTIITSHSPNDEEFREALLEYARTVRERMAKVTLKSN